MNSEPKMIPVETPVPITWLDISWNARVRMTNDPALRDQMTNGRLRVPNSRQKYSARTRTQLSTFKVRRLWSRGPVVPLVRFSPSRPVVRGPWSRGFSPGFTLIELLVVIAIIAILAALLLPAIAHARIHAQKTQAKTDVQSIVNAVHKYESEYNRMPIAREVLGYAVANNEDYTFGTAGLTAFNDGAGGTVDVLSLDSAGGALPAVQQRNNSELMGILLDMDNFGGVPTRNTNHVLNTQHTKYLNAKMTSDANTGGVGPDGVYRDPWKKPYIITMDANSDEKSRDSFYRSGTVSADPSNAARGLFGMIPVKVNNTTWYEVNQPVIAWSAGPDGLINKNKSAIQDANKDNVISWGQ